MYANRISTCFCALALLLIAALTAPGAERLKVSDNRRFLVYEDGRPFFYLGDTAWELFHKLNRDEAVRYLEDRARKQFTVIQAVVLAELDGLNAINPYGHTPLKNNDPTQPDEEYFRPDLDPILGLFFPGRPPCKSGCPKTSYAQPQQAPQAA